MMPKRVYITSILILLASITSTAQDSVLVNNSKFALHLTVDYGKGIESLLSEQKKWEFGIGAIIKNKLAVNVEYGYGKLYPEGVIMNGTYEVEGNYYRGGAEYIFTVGVSRYLSLGAMYASSTFDDMGSVQITSEFWQDLNEEFYRPNYSAQWAEIIMNTEGPVFNAEEGFLSSFYWGVRFRLRLMITDLDRQDFDIYAIPGYGKTYSKVLPAANFFLKYRINFK